MRVYHAEGGTLALQAATPGITKADFSASSDSLGLIWAPEPPAASRASTGGETGPCFSQDTFQEEFQVTGGGGVCMCVACARVCESSCSG